MIRFLDKMTVKCSVFQKGQLGPHQPKQHTRREFGRSQQRSQLLAGESRILSWLLCRDIIEEHYAGAGRRSGSNLHRKKTKFSVTSLLLWVTLLFHMIGLVKSTG